MKQVVKKKRGRPPLENKKSSYERKKEQLERDKNNGVAHITLRLGKGLVDKIDFLVNSYSRLNKRTDLLNHTFSELVDTFYHRTKMFDELIVLNTKEEREVRQIANDGFYDYAQSKIGLTLSQIKTDADGFLSDGESDTLFKAMFTLLHREYDQGITENELRVKIAQEIAMNFTEKSS